MPILHPMLTFAILVSFLAAALVLRVCAAQIQDGQTLHDLTVQVHTLRNEYLTQLRGDTIIEVDEVSSAEPADQPIAGHVGPEPAPAQAA